MQNIPFSDQKICGGYNSIVNIAILNRIDISSGSWGLVGCQTSHTDYRPI